MKLKGFQNLIDKIRGKKINKYPNYFEHSMYGRVYTPYYNKIAPLVQKEHDIYNADGNKMRTFFIRDTHLAHNPFYESKYFIWDRFNYNLKIHFYSHESMLETMGNPEKKYGFLIESKSIATESYKIFDTHKGLENDFDMIFTYNSDILEKINNAKFVPFCAQIWNPENIIKDAHKIKTKNVSILSSDKLMCNLHKFRYDLAWKCNKEGLADTFGTFNKGNYVNLCDTLNNYRYTICIENAIEPYFFTERITTAFAAQTIPIYIGATKINEFFNEDGIISFSEKDNIEDVLKQCTEEEYQRRLPAILDNCKRAEQYYNIWDYMYEKFLAFEVNRGKLL